MKHVIAPSTRIVVEFMEKEYTLHRPKLGAIIELEEKIEEAKKGGISPTKVLAKLVQECGLPKKVLDELDNEGLHAIVELLKPDKKK